jgi:uncharacterized protein YcsI (UPF0317 family)
MNPVVGEREPKDLAPGADIASDLPKYRVYRYGNLHEEVHNFLV